MLTLMVTEAGGNAEQGWQTWSPEVDKPGSRKKTECHVIQSWGQPVLLSL